MKAPDPGRIYRAIADLSSLLGSRLRIITTNYDDVLERAILDQTEFRPRSLIVGKDGALAQSVKYPDGDIEVVHLHGLIPYEGRGGGIDYSR